MFFVWLLCGYVAGYHALPLDSTILNYAKKFPNTGEPNPEYGNLYDGDIEIDDRFETAEQPGLLNAMWDLSKRWPDNTLYYQIRSGEYTATQIGQIEDGIRDLKDSTDVGGESCLTFVNSASSNYVDVYQYSGCSSYIGMIGGSQRMSLVSSCVNRHGTIMHEFLHALGFHHEHKRADRDDYVTINEDNIQEGRENNFVKLVEGVSVDHMETAYDYGSVMHYSAYAFAEDPSIPTIVPTDPNAEIGQRERLSDLDIERVQIFYCCIDAADSKYHQHMADFQRDYC